MRLQVKQDYSESIKFTITTASKLSIFDGIIKKIMYKHYRRNYKYFKKHNIKS